MSRESPYVYSYRAARSSHTRAHVTCTECNNEILLMHAPRRPFLHWCLRCDKPTLHGNVKRIPTHTLPPRELDDTTRRERLRAYNREYARRRRNRSRGN